METSVFKNWWLLTLNGIAAIIFGTLAVLTPKLTLLLLVVYFGVLAVFIGMFFIIGGLMNFKTTDLWDFWIFEGVLNLIIGIIILASPEISIKIFLLLIGVWALLIGMIQIISAVKMKYLLNDYWIYILNGILAIVFAIVVLINPFESALVITTLLGVYAIILGIFSIFISLKMRRITT